MISKSEISELSEKHKTPFAIVECDIAVQQYYKLQNALGSHVDIHYAVKALPDSELMMSLAYAGAYFDIASMGEEKLVDDLGFAPHKCLYTHPIKTPAEIERLVQLGYDTFVVGSVYEMVKFVSYTEKVKILIRIASPSDDAQIDLSEKFGCPWGQVEMLMSLARNAGIRLAGFTFHVGSQCMGPQAYVDAILFCAKYEPDVLDIGGGFPVSYGNCVPDIMDFCKPIREALGELPARTRIIAEPGRFIAAPAVTTVSSVIGYKFDPPYNWYYLDDGVYSSFSGKKFDIAHYPLETIREGVPEPTILAGPTCDGRDIVTRNIELPQLQNEDLVIGRMMGAYSLASATNFSHMPQATRVYR